ncbi:MAG: gluconate 2-dehydrogenase subunit 3 family protein [Bryobacterales bacterium]|nr:gluconate 2-dehydrogenase subunit 3 family protein [Bryobacterales bacterium]
MNRRELIRITASAAGALPALSQTAAWKPKVLDAHQNETVIALTELIIPATDTPGAKAAQVNRYIDLLLADGAATDRDRFLDGLAFLDGFAIRQHKAPFVKCTSAQQTAVLETLDRGGDASLESGHRFFRMAKQLTSRIYYATEIGFRELNKGGRAPAKYGCTHSDQHREG